MKEDLVHLDDREIIVSCRHHILDWQPCITVVWVKQRYMQFNIPIEPLLKAGCWAFLQVLSMITAVS